MAYTAMKYCRSISDRVQHRTASDSDHERMPVDRKLGELSQQA